jgi:hypothetical protein
MRVMKFVPSPLGLGQLSGKGGSVVASHNRFGSYLRTRVIPVNPASSAQMAARSRFALTAEAWRNLTDSQRESWEAAAAEYVRTDAQGESFTYNGFMLFMSNNNVLRWAGVSPLTVPDLAPTFPSLGTLTFTATVTGTVLTLGYTGTLGANFGLMIYLTRCYSLGKTYVGDPAPRTRQGKGLFKLMDYLAADETSPADLYSRWNARFGTLNSGQKISCSVAPFSKTLGYIGPFRTVVATVGA